MPKSVKPVSYAAAPPKFIPPMLASAQLDERTVDEIRQDWYAKGTNCILDHKYDGHRLIVFITDMLEVFAWSRNGKPRALPKRLIKAMRQRLKPGIYYDGELYVLGGTCSDVSRKDKQKLLRYAVFDVIILDKNYSERRTVVTCIPPRGVVHASTTYYASISTMTWLWAKGAEGGVVKRYDSPYRPGKRTADWIKIKKLFAGVVTVTGFAGGIRGKYASFLGVDHAGVEVTLKTQPKELKAVKKDPKSWIGKQIVFCFTDKSSSGRYRGARFDHILESPASGDPRDFA